MPLGLFLILPGGNILLLLWVVLAAPMCRARAVRCTAERRLLHRTVALLQLALPTLLRRLKAGGYKVVAMKAKGTLDTLPEYDAMVGQDPKLPTTMTNARPISSVIQTVSQ